ATGAADAAANGPTGNSVFDRYRSESYFTDNAKSWFTGFNAEGTNNGWENTFHAAYQDQWNEALEKGTAREFFSQPNATGVVTWDHKGKNAKGETVDFKFGDVYENGEKKANVFD